MLYLLVKLACFRSQIFQFHGDLRNQSELSFMLLVEMYSSECIFYNFLFVLQLRNRFLGLLEFNASFNFTTADQTSALPRPATKFFSTPTSRRGSYMRSMGRGKHQPCHQASSNKPHASAQTLSHWICSHFHSHTKKFFAFSLHVFNLLEIDPHLLQDRIKTFPEQSEQQTSMRG